MGNHGDIIKCLVLADGVLAGRLFWYFQTAQDCSIFILERWCLYLCKAEMLCFQWISHLLGSDNANKWCAVPNVSRVSQQPRLVRNDCLFMTPAGFPFPAVFLVLAWLSWSRFKEEIQLYKCPKCHHY